MSSGGTRSRSEGRSDAHRPRSLADEQEAQLSQRDRLIEENPSDHNAYFDRGALLFSMGRWAEAIRDWSAALERSPTDVEALNQPTRGRTWPRPLRGVAGHDTMRLRGGSHRGSFRRVRRRSVASSVRTRSQSWDGGSDQVGRSILVALVRLTTKSRPSILALQPSLNA